MTKKFSTYQITCLFGSLVSILVVIGAASMRSLVLICIGVILFLLCLWCFKTKSDNEDKELTTLYTVKIDYNVDKHIHTETITVDNPSDLAKFYKMYTSYIRSNAVNEGLLWTVNSERRQVNCIEITPELSFEDLLTIDGVDIFDEY